MRKPGKGVGVYKKVMAKSSNPGKKLVSDDITDRGGGWGSCLIFFLRGVWILLVIY